MSRLPGIALAAVLSGAIASAQSATSALSADTLARALQEHYDKIHDFKASFEQTFRGGVLRGPSSKGEGTVAVKKPGRMRWDYTKPDRQLIVSDGTILHSCVQDTKKWECDEPVPVPRDNDAPSAALFLAGRGDIVRDFKVSRVESPVRGGTLALRLDPRKPDPDYEYLVVAFDPATYQIRGLTTRDHQAGESTIVFTDIKVNTNIPDKTFVFTPPRSVSK